jgi:hypothetical protein
MSCAPPGALRRRVGQVDALAEESLAIEEIDAVRGVGAGAVVQVDDVRLVAAVTAFAVLNAAIDWNGCAALPS